MEFELQGLRRARFRFRRDQDAEDQGVLHLAGTARLAGRNVALEIWYPAGFPLAQPQFYTPGLALPRHQHPYHHNLCVWPTGTEKYDWGTTSADLYRNALRLIEASLTGDEAVRDIEEGAPDFRSAFYPHTPGSSLLLPENLLDIASGAFGQFRVLGITPNQPLRGLIREVRFLGHEARISDPRLRTLYGGSGEVLGPWVRLDEYPPFFPLSSFVDDFFDWFANGPGRMAWHTYPSRGGLGWLSEEVQLAAVCFPEEFGYRDYSKVNWLAVLRAPGKNASVVYRSQILPEDSGFQRIPRLAGVRGSHATIVGLGAVGSTVAVALARAGVGKVTLIDGDILEPANLVRHQLTLREVGLPKAEAMKRHLAVVAPLCGVRAVSMPLGAGAVDGPITSDASMREMQALFEKSDIIICGAADDAVNHLVNRLAGRASKPQVYVWATNGAWGGEVLRVIPGETACFSCFKIAAEDTAFGLARPEEDPLRATALGCADRTFTGAGFDLDSVALGAVRLTVQTLLRGDAEAYPDCDYDYISMGLTGRDSLGLPTVLDRRRIPPSTRCTECQAT